MKLIVKMIAKMKLSSLIVVMNFLNSFREVKMSSSEEPTEPTQFEVELQTDANASNDNAMPTLRPYDQTPITPGEKNNTAKRPCTELSPVNKCEMITTDIWKKIEGTIVSTINNAIPNIIENIVCEMQCTFNTMIEEAVKRAKMEIIDNVGRDIEFVDTKNEMLARCEAEQLETYNRRDIVKILGLQEDLNENGQPLGENLHQTMEKVLALANTLETCVDVKDISIAQRLPSRKGQVKPIIVKFSKGGLLRSMYCERRKFCLKKEVIFEFSKT